MDTILLIEDDIKLQKYMKEYLTPFDFKVEVVEDFDMVLKLVGIVKPNLIILDINLPQYDGFYYLKLIRMKHRIPVIILSARSEESEQIRGMEIGADDYITKPFSPGILMAKINAVLRRSVSEPVEKELNYGGLYLNSENMKLAYRGLEAELSKNEYKIMKILILKKEKVVTREELLEALWDDTTFVDYNTLTVNMSRVKKKLMDIGYKDSILTKRGIGYVLVENGDPSNAKE